MIARWGAVDPFSAYLFAVEHTAAPETMRGFLSDWRSRDKEELFGFIEALDDEEKIEDALFLVGKTWVEENPEEVVVWLNEEGADALKGSALAVFLKEIGRTVSTEKAVELLDATFKKYAKNIDAIAGFAAVANLQNPARIMSWAGTLPAMQQRRVFEKIYEEWYMV